MKKIALTGNTINFASKEIKEHLERVRKQVKEVLDSTKIDKSKLQDKFYNK